MTTRLFIGKARTVTIEEHIEFSGCQEATDKADALKEVREDVKKRLEVAYSKHRNAYNLRRRDVEFQLGEVVWMRNFVLSDASKHFRGKTRSEIYWSFQGD